MNRSYFLFLFFIFSFLLVNPDYSFAQTASMNLKSAGCKTEYFCIKDLAEAYETRTGVSIDMGRTGNKKAIFLLLDKELDFAFTCKPLEKLAKSFKLEQEKIVGWKTIPIAKDPLILLSNEKNGVENLSSAQIVDIFTGKIKNWKEVGGADLPITLAIIDPKLESGMPTVFKECLECLDKEFDKDAKPLPGPAELGNFVSSTPGGITFVNFISYKKELGTLVKINGVEPNGETIKNNTYLLSVTYNLIFDPSHKPVADFVDFCLSEEGQKAISKNFVFFTE